MKLEGVGALLTIPAFLFAQAPAGDDSRRNVAGGSANLPASSAVTPTAVAAAPGAVIEPLTPGEKVKTRGLRIVEPVTLLSSGFGAAIEQWRDVPHEWGQGAEGYGYRFASAEGFVGAHEAIALGFDLALHTDPRYRRMPEGKFKARLWSSVSQSFLANKDSGGRMINVGEIASDFGAGFVANTWNPRGYDTTGDALVRGALGLAYHTAKNVAREFLPDILHPHKHAHAAGASPTAVAAGGQR